MTGESLQAMPMSPRQSPADIGVAAMQWACTRRGRTLMFSIVFLLALFGVVSVGNREVCCRTPFQGMRSIRQRQGGYALKMC